MVNVTDLVHGGAEGRSLGALEERAECCGYLPQSYLNSIALRLNQRPRKTLGFETPADKLREVLH